jgi:hypothetical protein
MSMTGDVAFAAFELSVNSSEKPHRAHGLFVLVPCTCGQQTNVRPEDRFQRGHSTFGSVGVEKKKAPGGALEVCDPCIGDAGKRAGMSV